MRHGLEGMEEDSRRPRRSPKQLSEGEVCEMVGFEVAALRHPVSVFPLPVAEISDLSAAKHRVESSRFMGRSVLSTHDSHFQQSSA